MNNRILYLGGFELPDKNAAAHRVVANAKIFRDLGYEVLLMGITKDGTYNGFIENFSYSSIKYPKNYIEWIKYIITPFCLSKIASYKPSIIIAYNYPSIALFRLLKFCKKHKIKLICDITEWYESKNPIKQLDTFFRMKYLNKKVDGLIVISKYLKNYYSVYKTLLLPPLVDVNQQKWIVNNTSNTSKYLNLIYAGSPGSGGKDRLDLIIDLINKTSNNIYLTIVGITKEQFQKDYSNFKFNLSNVKFLGKLSHLETLNIISKSDFYIFFRENKRVNNAGFPTKLVESLTIGIPVITNLTSDINDFLIEGENGFIVDISSKENAAKLILSAINTSKDKIENIKMHCKHFNPFDYRLYITKMELFLKDLYS